MQPQRVTRPLLLALLCASPALAQDPGTPGTLREPGQIAGQIVDAITLQPVLGIAVRIIDLELSARMSDSEGRFHLTGIPPGVYELEFRHIAYGTQRHLVNVPEGDIVDLSVRLSTQPIALDEIRVEARVRNWALRQRGYFDRKKLGFGKFFEREDFERWDLHQILRQVPGSRIGYIGRSSLAYYPLFRGSRGYCVPAIYIDGRHIRLMDNSLSDLVSGSNIEAMEVYRGITTPPEFVPPSSDGFDCGAVVIWTRTAHS